jgi:hypothetical protein
VENQVLNFSFIHNDTLFRNIRSKYLYTSHTKMTWSIAGYVAKPVSRQDC